MSKYLKIFKLGRTAMTNCRLANIQRSISLSAFQLQNLKDGPLKNPMPEAEKPASQSPEGLTPLQRNLLELVTAEIVEERRVQLQLQPPYMVDGFTGHFSGSKVELVRESPGERINIFFNVSKSVPRRSDEASDLSPPSAFEDMESDSMAQPFQENDVFEIQDLSLYNQGWNDSCFTVDASLIDDDLQDMILETLEEKGITQEFGRKLSDFATAREHALYIEFLENLSKFTVGIPQPIKEVNN
ncbi:complement component 1 Q subcomponent-binding protein, mitochondrial-like [Drosophila innubila]|uniref:complement component 1 Q subcomponent-binding protein, mitochondrial-like n=1 Tax=Drosophila innubila TaxID=198719 RepID=UPI00148C7365|nr:complement component 1 Q subcomponent-binding protein, mitochondrial-like [Drosophila innubila]